jgi:hypothetical protein
VLFMTIQPFVVENGQIRHSCEYGLARNVSDKCNAQIAVCARQMSLLYALIVARSSHRSHRNADGGSGVHTLTSIQDRSRRRALSLITSVSIEYLRGRRVVFTSQIFFTAHHEEAARA